MQTSGTEDIMDKNHLFDNIGERMVIDSNFPQALITDLATVLYCVRLIGLTLGLAYTIQ